MHRLSSVRPKHTAPERSINCKINLLIGSSVESEDAWGFSYVKCLRVSSHMIFAHSLSVSCGVCVVLRRERCAVSMALISLCSLHKSTLVIFCCQFFLFLFVLIRYLTGVLLASLKINSYCTSLF